MSTLEDFKNATFGATATRDGALPAIKIGDGERRWLTPVGTYLDDEEMMILGYTLNPTVPATAREALDLAWELAHEVKEGQNIPKGTRYLVVTSLGLKEYTSERSFWIAPAYVTTIRTVEPLPDPEPDWIDAPAILASHPLCADTERIGIWLPSLYKDGMWELPVQQGEFRVHWSELENVTPLYPKGQEA